MRALISVCCVVLAAFSLSACGNKGKLKTPQQIEAQEAKKAKKEAKDAADKQANEPEAEQPAAPDVEKQ